MLLTLYRKWILKHYFQKIKSQANNRTYFAFAYENQFKKQVVPEIGLAHWRLHRKLHKEKKQLFNGLYHDNLFLGQNWATIVETLTSYNRIISRPSFQIRHKRRILLWIRWKLFWAKKKVQPGETYRYF